MRAIDVVMAAALVLAGHSGYRRGLGETLWSAIAWILIPTAGAVGCVPLGAALSRWFGLSFAPAHWFAYVAIAVGVVLSVGFLQRRLGDRLSAEAPWGQGDGSLGAIAGAIAGAGIVFVAMALLHPFPGGTVDWNPQDMSGDQAVSALFSAILGSLRRVVLEESWAGQTIVRHFAGGLVPSGPS